MKYKVNKIPLVLMIAASLAGCASTQYAKIIATKPLPMENPDTSFIIVADNQIMEDLGAPIKETTSYANLLSGKTSKSTEKFRGSARRWTKLNMFGPELLSWIIRKEKNSTNKPVAVLYLGDAMQLSCKSEFLRFKDAISSPNIPWFMAPGNHDGYYSGITYPDSDPRTNTEGFLDSYYLGWGGVCTPERYDEKNKEHKRIHGTDSNGVSDRHRMLEEQIFPKTKVVDALVKNVKGWNKSKNKCGISRMVSDPKSPLKRAFYSKNTNDPWQSFILQEVQSSNGKVDHSISFFMIDTGVFDERPDKITKGADSEGRLGDCQLMELENWIANSNSKTKIVAGHQPFKNINKAERNRLMSTFQKHGVSYYLSAHTHDGFDKIHSVETSGLNEAAFSFVEHNISSLIDTPLEYAVLNIQNMENSEPKIEFKRKVITYDEANNKVTPRGESRRPLSPKIEYINECQNKFPSFPKTEISLSEIGENFKVKRKSGLLAYLGFKEAWSAKAKKKAYQDQLEIHQYLLNWKPTPKGIPTIHFRNFEPSSRNTKNPEDSEYSSCMKKNDVLTESNSCLKISNTDDARNFIKAAQKNLKDLKRPTNGNAHLIYTGRLLSALEINEKNRSQKITDPQYSDLKACLAVSPW